MNIVTVIQILDFNLIGFTRIRDYGISDTCIKPIKIYIQRFIYIKGGLFSHFE